MNNKTVPLIVISILCLLLACTTASFVEIANIQAPDSFKEVRDNELKLKRGFETSIDFIGMVFVVAGVVAGTGAAHINLKVENPIGKE